MLRKSRTMYDDLWMNQSRSGFGMEPKAAVADHHRLLYWDALIAAVERQDFVELMAVAREAGRYQFLAGFELLDAIKRTVEATNMIEIALLEANANEIPPVEIVTELADLRMMIVIAVADGYNRAQVEASANPVDVSSERLRAALNRNRNKHTTIDLAAGEEIGPLYDQGLRFYAIEMGKLRLYNLLPNGRTITLSILSEGDIFFQWRAETASLSCVCAEAMQRSTVIGVSQKDLVELLGAQPTAAVDIIGNFARRLTESQVLIEDLMNSSINLRLYRTLLELARQFGRRDNGANSILIDIPLTHQRLADMIGSNRVTVTRKLLDLQKRGIVGTRGSGSLAIIDLAALDKLALRATE